MARQMSLIWEQIFPFVVQFKNILKIICNFFCLPCNSMLLTRQWWMRRVTAIFFYILTSLCFFLLYENTRISSKIEKSENPCWLIHMFAGFKLSTKNSFFIFLFFFDHLHPTSELLLQASWCGNLPPGLGAQTWPFELTGFDQRLDKSR